MFCNKNIQNSKICIDVMNHFSPSKQSIQSNHLAPRLRRPGLSILEQLSSAAPSFDGPLERYQELPGLGLGCLVCRTALYRKHPKNTCLQKPGQNWKLQNFGSNMDEC